jgi:hypothetical protein
MIRAVITGDIIHSTRMDDKSRKLLNKVLAQHLKQLSSDYNIRSEMYRGDSFQCLVSKPQDALRVALLIKTKIRSLNPSEPFSVAKSNKPAKVRSILYTTWMFDARMAIGIGDAANRATQKLVTTSDEAFILSGHQLDELKGIKQALGISTLDKYRDELQTEILLLDTIIAKTTALQCEVIHLKLQDYSEIEIAKKLKIGQSAVNQRSNLGSWNAIRAMVDRFETIYEK